MPARALRAEGQVGRPAPLGSRCETPRLEAASTCPPGPCGARTSTRTSFMHERALHVHSQGCERSRRPGIPRPARPCAMQTGMQQASTPTHVQAHRQPCLCRDVVATLLCKLQCLLFARAEGLMKGPTEFAEVVRGTLGRGLDPRRVARGSNPSADEYCECSPSRWTGVHLKRLACKPFQPADSPSISVRSRWSAAPPRPNRSLCAAA